MGKQANLIKTMTDKELLLNVYISQFIMLVIAFVLGLFWFADWQLFFELLYWDVNQIVRFGVVPALMVVTIELGLLRWLPKDLFDDGGINERIFAKRSVGHILIIAAVVSIAEEILFRGVLQTHIGFVLTSLLFAFIHFRYLAKVFLFIMVVLLSFFLGWLFVMTENLLVTITAHFLIDFLLGIVVMIRSKHGHQQSKSV